MDQEKQGPSALVRDITEPGWREKEAERDRAMAQVMQKVPLSRADENWQALPLSMTELSHAIEAALKEKNQ